MARAIDADRLADGLKLHRQPTDQKHKADRQWAVGYNAGLDRALYSIAYAPTLTQPNEGAKGKNVPANEPLTLEELKAEAKRQGYKLIKDENIRFEPCLCGGTRHEWWSGPEGVKVVCLRCGLESPWVPRSKGKNGVKKAWNAMILEKRKEQSHEDV